MKDTHNWFWEYGWLIGFALMFFLDLIVLSLDILVLGCIPRDPLVAWKSWKTWEKPSWGHIDPKKVQKKIEKREKIGKKNFPMPRFFSLDWL